jgi:succinate-semialdehyde dehydrogenase/glutarate-semialdehyde dehydrogenase
MYRAGNYSIENITMQLKNKNLLINKGFINGEWITASTSNETFAVTNPFDNSVITTLPNLGIEETKNAVDAAQAAFKEWKKYSAEERANLLKKWYALLIANRDDLGLLLTLEQGKPLTEAIGEINYGASFIEWFAEEARRNYGDVIPGHARDKRIITLKQPVGVVGIITPWNFPNAMIARKAGAALAAGCTIIIKPAANTPLSALAMAALAEEAGFPKGLINVVTSTKSSAVGLELCSNPVVKKISFTGSTQVGKILLKQCADTVKKVSMELGGNAPFIVFDDADIDEAVKGAMISKFRNAGQTCVCTNRIYVQAGVYEIFIEKFATAVKTLKMGNGADAGVEIGPLIDTKAVHTVKAMMDDAVAKGATIVTGGHCNIMGSTFFEPTVLSNANAEMQLAREEIFGPVAPVFKFETEEEVIQLANDTEFGLASYFYGQNMNRIWRVAEALEYGMVGINTGLISTAVAPFGGIKESGNGREGSKYGMDDYCEIKYLCMGVQV